MPSNSSQGDNIYTYHISNIKIHSHEDNKFGNINELIKEVPNDIYADINETGGLFTDVTNIQPCNDRRDYQIEHKTSNERMEMPLKDNSISDVNDSFFVRPIKVENIHEIPEINVGTGTSINEDIKMPIAQNNPLSTLSCINNPLSTLSSINNPPSSMASSKHQPSTLSSTNHPTSTVSSVSHPTSTLSSVSHPTSTLSSVNHPTSKLSSINNPPSSLSSSKHQPSTMSSVNHPTSTLSSVNHPTSTLSSVNHPTSTLSSINNLPSSLSSSKHQPSTLSSVNHPTSSMSSSNHQPSTLSSINNPPSSLSSSKHQPSTLSSVNHPTSSMSSSNHQPSTLSSINNPPSSLSSSKHQPSTLSSVNHPTSSMSSSNHQPSTLPSINQSPWISSFFPIVYTTRINDMTLSIRNIKHVRGKTKILSIYHQSKPKFKSVYSIFNYGNIYAIPKTKVPVKTYSRFKQKSEASSVNVADQYLNRFEVSRDAKVDSGEGTTTENNIEQVKDIISPVNSPYSLSTTRKKQISESSKTKMNSKISVHEPNLPEKKNSTHESALLQLNETDCDIIESDRELDQMISAILDNSLATDVQSNNKQNYEENTYNDEICCWYKREQIANNLSNMDARSYVVRSYHKCATSNCTCCCKPNEENLIIPPAPLCSRRTSKFNIHHIKTGIQDLEPTTTEHYTDVNSSESNMNNEIDNLNLKVEENIIDVNSPVIQSLEALRDVHFTFNSEGKLVANLASSITYYEAPTLHVLEIIFSVVNDQIAAHGFSPRDKISILLHNVMDKIKLDVHSNTATSTNNETTSKTMEQSMRLLPNLNKEQTKIDGINEHTDESTDFEKAKYSFMTKDKTIMPESSSKHPPTVSNIATKPYVDAIESLFRRDKKINNKQCLHIIETDNTDEITANSKLKVIADNKKVKRKLETMVAPRKMMCIKSDVKP